MSRPIAFLADQFNHEIIKALEIVNSIERVRATYASTHAVINTDLPRRRIELIYELAYIRVFQFWESFLEESFARYLCGYSNAAGRQRLQTGHHFFRTVADAHSGVRHGRPFALWHDHRRVIDRSRVYFVNGTHETVIISSLTNLEYFSHIRHRIAHSQDDARNKFNVASMNLCGKRFPGARPGVFLRSIRLTSTERWIETISYELLNLAQQIAF